MSLNIGLQMDPPGSLNYKKDSTYVLALEAQMRGYNIFTYTPDTLRLENKNVSADCAPIKFSRNLSEPYSMGTSSSQNLKDFDIILMRQDFKDPEFYNSTAHILDHVTQNVLVLNDPSGVRESPEKLLITHFPEFAPRTLITRNLAHIREFHKENKEIIIKPLNGFGGKDIYHLRENDDNLSAIYEMMCKLHKAPFVIQEYIKEVRQGDKRIIVVEGDPVAAVLRVPQDGEARANFNAGGEAQKTEITSYEREICEKLKPELIKRGLLYVGIDVIGQYVTEINPKSPTGLQHIYALEGIKCEEIIWNAIEKRYEEFRGNKRISAAL